MTREETAARELSGRIPIIYDWPSRYQPVDLRRSPTTNSEDLAQSQVNYCTSLFVYQRCSQVCINGQKSCEKDSSRIGLHNKLVAPKVALHQKRGVSTFLVMSASSKTAKGNLDRSELRAR